MAKVNLLPTEIISKIAAGEVIERPASVVKELVENSMDAGADSVELHLKQSGKTLIHVKDTGSGIDKEDIEKIFLRHSTSKISGFDDLFKIASLGFRGEALFSVAAISDIVLRSKIAGQDTGWEIHLRGGEKIDLKPVNMPVGTEIEVKEIFYNTPARRKFLKSDATELNQILNIFLPYTLLCPAQRFFLTHQGKTLIDLYPDKSAAGRISKALHIKEENIIETYRKSEDGSVTIKLFLGDINVQRVKKDMQFIFVNNRPVQDRVLSFHLNQVYRLIFPQNVYPFFAAYVELPPENVDVNMHPTKREVKIRNDRDIIHIIRPLSEHALMSLGHPKKVRMAGSGSIKPSLTGEKESFQYTEGAPETGRHYGKSQEIQEETSVPEEPGAKQYVLFKDSSPEKTIFGQDDTLRSKLSASRYLGAFMKKYLFFESGNSLLLIDQHAAQERITYEKLLEGIGSGRIEVQKLLTPVIISLSTQEMLAYEGVNSTLENIGFSTTQWDPNSVAIHAHPELIHNPEIALRNILAGEKPAHCSNETLARWACRSSVMAGDDVRKEFAEYLRNELLNCKDPFTCPHGRPTTVEIDEKFLNRQFLRG